MEIQFVQAPVFFGFLLCSIFLLPLSALNEDGIALLSFMASIKEDPGASMANWNSSDMNPCSWNGVLCKEGKVVSLSLPKRSLSGSLSPSLGSLPSLRHINLRRNKLHGDLPAGLFQARWLQSLVLYGNSLSGSLPPEMGDLFNLQTLDLSFNSFNGSIPSSLLQCKKLKTLDLSYNNLTGSLPSNFGRSFHALVKLNLAYNRLNGSIPIDFGKLSSLQGTVDLSHNLFSGSIPPSLGDLPEKAYIDLAFNNLSGPVPQNGALANRGPTAFIGNPGLCGPPLKYPCSGTAASSPLTLPDFPTNDSPLASEAIRRGHRVVKRTVVIAIVVSDVAAIGFMALLFYCCYRKASIASKGKEEAEKSNKRLKLGKTCICLGEDEPDTLSENFEQYDLIPLDKELHFDLDSLLKANASLLGKSGIGIMYKVVLEDGFALAVRRLGDGSLQRFKDFQTEVEAIGRVRHPNIVSLRAYYWSVNEKLLVYNYVPSGNLSTVIHGTAASSYSSALSWNVRLRIIKGVAKGLAFLHEFSPKKYVHGDMNPNNILLGLEMEPYISDFGLGHLANIPGGLSPMNAKGRGNMFSDTAAVSPILTRVLCYQAPEALKAPKPSQKWDVYSYGVILLEIISGRSPIALLDTSDMDLVQWIELCIASKKPLRDILDPNLAREPENEEGYIQVLEIALACVQSNPERRPTMKHVADSLGR